MEDKIGIIAQTFGYTSGTIEVSPCSGKWQGMSDISIVFDNGASLAVGNEPTLRAQTAETQNEYVNYTVARYNPEIVAATKALALIALRKREPVDNLIAAQKGLKPYTLLNVELNNGLDDRSSLYLGWYYVTLAVDGKIRAHLESGLAHHIASGTMSEAPMRENYYAAGALKKTDVDYIFHNVGFSSNAGIYSLPITDEALERAKKSLAERGVALAHKPSIKIQLAAKPILGGARSERPRDTGAR